MMGKLVLYPASQEPGTMGRTRVSGGLTREGAGDCRRIVRIQRLMEQTKDRHLPGPSHVDLAVGDCWNHEFQRATGGITLPVLVAGIQEAPQITRIVGHENRGLLVSKISGLQCPENASVRAVRRQTEAAPRVFTGILRN